MKRTWILAVALLPLAAGSRVAAAPPDAVVEHIRRELAGGVTLALGLGTAADSGSVAVSSTADTARGATPVPSTPEIERACRALSSDDLLRIDGGFGRFVGYASTIAPSGLDGLRTDPSMHSTWAQRSLGWEQVDQLDVQRNGVMRGAALGLLITTAIVVAATGGAIALEGGIPSGEGPFLYQYVAYFGLIAIPVGTVLGAIIGAASPYWHHVYRRP